MYINMCLMVYQVSDGPLHIFQTYCHPRQKKFLQHGFALMSCINGGSNISNPVWIGHQITGHF